MRSPETADLAAARAGDSDAFARLVEPHRAELRAHCYRLLASDHDADDALQDALLAAWRGLDAFEGRSSLRTWLYRIATNASFTLAARRSRGGLGCEPISPAPHDDADIAAPAGAADPEARYDQIESVKLAFVAAVHRLPATQRAALILRDVLAFPAVDVAARLNTTVPSVTSALQRARHAMNARPAPRDRATVWRHQDDSGQRERVDALVAAWERADVEAIVDLLADDARFRVPTRSSVA